jgi:type II secretory ATPase GspE/PulE/Tfp pilus assembly ATPase PilB-like protein
MNLITEQVPNIKPSPDQHRKRLGNVLIEHGLINVDQLEIALKEQRNHKLPLGETLLGLGFITQSVLRVTLSQMFGKAEVDLSNFLPDIKALKLISKKISIQLNIIPVSLDENQGVLSIAISDIYNLHTLDKLRNIIGKDLEIEPLLAGKSEIFDAIDQFYGYELSIDGILQEIETGKVDSHTLTIEGATYSQPLVRLVDAILVDAVRHGASDIHLDPESHFLRLRYRIDGVLRQIRSLHKDYLAAIVVRLKVMSNMNIAETRAPQDGRINLNIRGHQIDFRVSSQPTTHGEKIVLRILDRAKGIVPINELGLRKKAYTQLKFMMAKPEGIILVTGPTGSGKTTTLYSMLSYIRSVDINIMTLEDPVEYPMELICQTSINEVSRMNFSNGIRSIMRQDPDIILIGEIRDSDTAEMALRAAMTGHQVYSTLHTNSAIGAIPRLSDMGIKASILCGNITGIIGQRLVRKLCHHCKISHMASVTEKSLLCIDQTEPLQVFTANGCKKCADIGYKGRLAILEILRIDSQLDELIAAKSSLGRLKEHLKQQGFNTLADNASQQVINGLTSLDEVTRVIDLTDRL